MTERQKEIAELEARVKQLKDADDADLKKRCESVVADITKGMNAHEMLRLRDALSSRIQSVMVSDAIDDE